mmetsp:Transcript_12314/g.16134  ORF Transcript_12314/g.16134 Transcript_12314/m.16134 type:complete len:89 (+) Transcript_12314:131-397(+)
MPRTAIPPAVFFYSLIFSSKMGRGGILISVNRVKVKLFLTAYHIILVWTHASQTNTHTHTQKQQDDHHPHVSAPPLKGPTILEVIHPP